MMTTALVVLGFQRHVCQWQRLLRTTRCAALLFVVHCRVGGVERVVCVRRIILPGRIWYQFVLRKKKQTKQISENRIEFACFSLKASISNSCAKMNRIAIGCGSDMEEQMNESKRLLRGEGRR